MKDFRSGNYVDQKYYKCFIPSKINRKWIFNDMEILTLLSKADRMLGRLDMYSEHVPNLDLFISMHVMKEATQSSKIEGTQTRMEEAVLPEEEVPLDRRNDWIEVRNYIKAMNEAIKMMNNLPFSSRLIRNVHKILLQGVRGESKQPGEYRRSQNWIGGSSINDAAYIPPTYDVVPELIEDIEKFVHNDSLYIPDLLKIAIIHYQFETIHPFLDGNGRTGRLMITLYLVSVGILKQPILYLSDYLERHRNSYYNELTNARDNNDLSGWLKFFLKGVIETAQNGVNTFSLLMKLQQDDETLIKNNMGSRSANALNVVNQLYKDPIITASSVSKLLDITPASSYSLLASLLEIGIIEEITGAKRGRIYAHSKYIRIFSQN